MATSWVPVAELTGARAQVVTAQSTSGTVLDRWATQGCLPVARVPLTAWLFGELGYVWPGSTGRRWPT